MNLDIYLPVWFVGNRYSLRKTWSEHGAALIFELFSQRLFQIEILYHRKIIWRLLSHLYFYLKCVLLLLVPLYKNRLLTDWNLCFVCGIDELKPLQLTKLSARKGNARQYPSCSCLHHTFPYLPSATTVTPKKL